MTRREPWKPGLPAERTLMSWERSAFGFLVGGALVLLRQHGPLGPGRVALALLATVLALLVLGVGYRRSRQIRESPVIAGRLVVLAPRAEVLVIGGATFAFAAAIVAALLFAP
ncbi:DUF202 domain-containing protein [Mycolicibacterium sp. CR10]|uniref:DUF202 domain-containing protein n=1 Tax=Mycolicibacterium sp. CR10 TaxID=2562314 RepID=UPI0010BF6BE0|nr:DUF202 domain-containing protein [Mycolicibacterium sp. CR10]